MPKGVRTYVDDYIQLHTGCTFSFRAHRTTYVHTYLQAGGQCNKCLLENSKGTESKHRVQAVYGSICLVTFSNLRTYVHMCSRVRMSPPKPRTMVAYSTFQWQFSQKSLVKLPQFFCKMLGELNSVVVHTFSYQLDWFRPSALTGKGDMYSVYTTVVRLVIAQR